MNQVETWDKLADRIVLHYFGNFVPTRFTNELDVMRRLSNIHTRNVLQEWLGQPSDTQPADDTLSNQYRTKGNEMFQRKASNHLMLVAYSKAILAAPSGSRALALGHANRAVVLIRLGRYREAYDDCQLALDGDYPEEKRLKVYFRQAECAESMNDPSKLGSIVDGLAKMATDPSKVLSKGERDRLQTLQAKYDAAEKRTVEAAELSDAGSFLARVNICSTGALGRHAIAREAIQQDQVIARETAFSFVPVYDTEGRSKYGCQKCAKMNAILFPCPTCRSACYCSIQCRDDHRPVHRFECAGYQKHLWQSVGIAHLGIRTFLEGFDTIRSELLKLCATTPPDFKAFLREATSGEANEFDRYRQVLGLVTNFGKMNHDDLLRYALTGLMLSIYLLEFTPFLSDHGLTQGIDKCQLGNCCAALILRHIGQLVCNGHAISELRAKSAIPMRNGMGDRETLVLLQEDSFVPRAGFLHLCFSSARVFTAIFPRISMLNHSCKPNIRNHFDRSTLTVHATGMIPPGGEVLNCYGPHYKLVAPEWRLMCLKQQYCFDCNCGPCSSQDDTFLQKFCVINCTRCSQQFSMELILEKLQAGKSIYCYHCSAEIDTDWCTIDSRMSDDSEHLDENFQKIVTLYDRSKQTLIGLNQTKAEILEAILHHYTKHGSSSHFLHSTLQEYAIELISMRREQFESMSLEFLTACFYLLDLWALRYMVNGNKPVQLKKQELTALNEFRAAISMVGTENRLRILQYMKQFVILDEVSPAEA